MVFSFESVHCMITLIILLLHLTHLKYDQNPEEGRAFVGEGNAMQRLYRWSLTSMLSFNVRLCDGVWCGVGRLNFPHLTKVRHCLSSTYHNILSLISAFDLLVVVQNCKP